MAIVIKNPMQYRRRKIGAAMMEILCLLSAAVALFVLALIVKTLLEKGLAALNLQLFTHSMASPEQGGGLSNAIVGSLIQAGLGIGMATPLGIAVGVYLAEVGGNKPLAQVVRFVNDILLSAPSVLIGLFVYRIMVVPMHGFSGLAGSIALGLLAMPVICRTTEDIIKLVPQAYRDASTALGARSSTTILKVVLPAAFQGILTGVLLAFARIFGETAPLIFTSLGANDMSLDLGAPMASLPVAIYRYASSPYDAWINQAWSGALVITLGVLLLNISSRMAQAYFGGRIKQQ